MNITRPVRGFLLAGAATISAIAILPTTQRPAAAASAITTPAFMADRAIVPPEGHGVTLAMGTGDNLYVLLSDGAQVQKFDATLTQLPYTGTGNGGGAGSAANQFGASTSGIAVYRGGAGNTNILNDRIIVADRVNNRIKVLDAFGNLVFQFGSGGTSKAQFSGTITAIDVDQVTGKIYVVDGLGFERVQKFDLSGNFERMWGWGVKTGAAQFEICTSLDAVCFPGQTGGGAGQFNLFHSTGGVTTDGTSVFVSDTENYRIQKFDLNGNYLATWGSQGSGNGQCADYGCLGIRYSNGLLYVADSYPNNRIQIFDTNGVFQGAWGDSTTFREPEDIAIASTGEEFVGDFFPIGLGRLSKWSAAANRHPTNKDQCRNGGYANYVDDNNQPFRNQGRCVSYVNHH
ncbi:MAG: tripartite motif-containing protein 71 [Hyphomicrobiales bacterium]|nr:tripartite motif-containing protein 71 [Hyphomicrobiales bacterium]